MNYLELSRHVLDEIPEREAVSILAESFSGPIAYQVAASGERDVRSLVFCASFLTCPRPKLLALTKILPPLSIRPPDWFIRMFCLDSGVSSEVLDLFYKAIRQVPASVLFERLRCLSRIESPDTTLRIQSVYLRPSSDWLIPARGLEDMREFLPEITELKIKGPHFILQARPKESARLVADFIEQLC